jgi:hypothetical protein
LPANGINWGIHKTVARGWWLVTSEESSHKSLEWFRLKFYHHFNVLS